MGRLLRFADRHFVSATALSFAAMVLVWGVTRLVAMVGLLVPGVVGVAVAAGLLCLLSAVVLSTTVIGPWRARTRHGSDPWDVAVFGASVASLGLYVESLATVSAALRRGEGLPVSPWGGLWQAEQLYLWHLVKSVPLVNLADTVGWVEPAYAAAHTPAAVILVFKLLVVVPLLRAAIEGFRMIVGRATDRATTSWAWRAGLADPLPVRAWLGLAGSVAWAVSGLVVLTLVFDQVYGAGSWVDRHWSWLLHLLHGDSPQLRPWLEPILLYPLPLLGLYLIGAVAGPLSGDELSYVRARTRMDLLAPVVQTVVWVYVAMLCLSGAVLALAHFRIGGVEPGGAHALWPVMATFGWHIVSSLPGPDVTQTLHWGEPVALSGTWLGWFALVPKLMLFGAVLGLWLPLARVAVVRQRYGPVLRFWAVITRRRVRPFETSGPEQGREGVSASMARLEARPEFAGLLDSARACAATVALPSGPPMRPAEDWTRAVDDAMGEFLAAVRREAPECAPLLELLRERAETDTFFAMMD